MGTIANAILGKSGEFFREIDSCPNIRGAGIVILDDEDQVTRIARTPNDTNKWVVLQIEFEPSGSAKAPPNESQYFTTEKLKQLGEEAWLAIDGYVTKKRLIAFGIEWGAGFLSCGGMVLSTVLLGAEAVGTTATVGATAAAMPWTVSALLASSASCGVSIGRIANVLLSETGTELNAELDAFPGYKEAMAVLDIIAIADLAKSIPSQYKNLKLLLADRQLAQAARAGNSHAWFSNQLKQMSEAERKVLLQEIKEASKSLELTAQQTQRFLKEGFVHARRVWNPKMQKALVDAMQARVRPLLQQAILAGSASSATAIGSATGGGVLSPEKLKQFRGVVISVVR